MCQNEAAHNQVFGEADLKTINKLHRASTVSIRYESPEISLSILRPADFNHDEMLPPCVMLPKFILECVVLSLAIFVVAKMLSDHPGK